jgi:hypothetical protein
VNERAHERKSLIADYGLAWLCQARTFSASSASLQARQMANAAAKVTARLLLAQG